MKSQNIKDHSPAVEDYLRAIYQLAEEQDDEDQRVTTSSLAARLDLRPASVTVMMQKMAAAEPPLVQYHKSFGVCLTADGRQAALAVVRCHRLLETFLHDRLGYGWDEVHDEADRLEHAISDQLADRLATALGNPTHDPHGHAIPAADLSLSQPPVIPLSGLQSGVSTTVEYVQDDDAERLRHLEATGLHPGRQVTVIDADSSAGLWVIVDDIGEPRRVDAKDAAAVFVSRVNS